MVMLSHVPPKSDTDGRRIEIGGREQRSRR